MVAKIQLIQANYLQDLKDGKKGKYENYIYPNPQRKVCQFLQLQCMLFFNIRYFLRTIKKLEVLSSFGNFAYAL